MAEKKTDLNINVSTGGSSMSNKELINLMQQYLSPKTSSLETHLDDTMARIKNTASNSVALKDHWGNSLSSTGTDDKVSSFTNYGFSNDTLNYTLWLALYNDSWVFKRAIDKPAQDEITCGITINGDEDYTAVYKAYNDAKNDLVNLLKWGALFGGSIAVVMFDGLNDADLGKTINKEKIKGKKMTLYVTDRWYGCVPSSETVTNMKNIDFGKPAYYEVTFADGHTCKVHHSYVLRYEHRNAPNLIKNGQLMGWGYAEGSHILNELSRDDQLKSAITSLVNKSLIEVIKMSGMRGVFMGADEANKQQLMKRLEMVNWARTFNSLTLLDKDDEYTSGGFTQMTGLSDLLEKNMWLISAALEMQGILFGDLKGGLSQESDAFKRYAKTILGRCDSLVRPVMNKFLKICFAVYDIKGDVDFSFNSLNKEEENNEKINAINGLVSMLSSINDRGLISKYQMALSIQDFMNKGSINIAFTEEQLNKLKLEAQKELLSSIKEFEKIGGSSVDRSGFPSLSRFNQQPMENEPVVEENQPINENVEVNTGESVNEEVQEE